MKYSTNSILLKALYSSSIGLPISLLLNLALVEWIKDVVTNNGHIEAALILSIPFFVASIMRIFLIDWVYNRYSVNIEPSHIIKKLVFILRRRKP